MPGRWHCKQVSRHVSDTGIRKAPMTPLNSRRGNVEGNHTASSRRKILGVVPQAATDFQATLSSEIVARPPMPLAKVRIENHVRPRNYGLIPACLLVECLEPTEVVAALYVFGAKLPGSRAVFWLDHYGVRTPPNARRSGRPGQCCAIARRRATLALPTAALLGAFGYIAVVIYDVLNAAKQSVQLVIVNLKEHRA